MLLAAFPLPIAGPDEATYLRISSDSLSGSLWESGSAKDQWLFIRRLGFVLPLQGLLAVGLQGTFASRLLSNLFLLAAGLILTLVASRAQDPSLTWKELPSSPLPLASLRTLTLLTFALLPSHFAWGSLGSRDTSVEFLTVSAFSLILLVIAARHRRTIVFGLVMLSLSIVLMFFTMEPVGWAFAVAGSATAVLLAFRALKRGVCLLVACLIAPAVFMVALGLVASIGGQEASGAGPTQMREEVSTVISAQLDTRRLRGTSEARAPKDATLATLDLSQLSLVERATAIALRPFTPADPIDNSTRVFWLASFEGPVWLVAWLLLLFTLVRYRGVFNPARFGALVFVLVFSSILLVSSGHLGIAFRHKVQLVPALAVAYVLSEPRFRRLEGDRQNPKKLHQVNRRPLE